MRPFSSVTVILAGLIFLTAAGASANQTEVIERLKFGGHVLMIRF